MGKSKTQPASYFLVKFWINKDEYSLGPYFELDYAMVVLVDHCPIITKAITNKRHNYKAEIHECILKEGLPWKTISIPIVENQCRRINPS